MLIRLPIRCLGEWYGDQHVQIITAQSDGLPVDHSRRVRVPFD